MRERVPLDIPVSAGLDLANPISGLRVGKLIRAKNKAAGVWGPRHGNTHIDKAARTRGAVAFNGTTTYLTAYYNPRQMDLGKKFTIDLLIKLGAVGAQRHVAGQDAAAVPAWDCTVESTGAIAAYFKDNGDNNVQLTTTTTYSEDDVLSVRLVRNGATVYLYVDGVIEATNNGTLSAAAVAKINADSDLLIGKTPTYGSGSYFNGTFGGLYIRSYVDTNFKYAFSEMPYPHGEGVLAAWTGETSESNAYVRDYSSYRNNAFVSNHSSGTKVPIGIEPVQFMKCSTAIDGRRRNLVVVGGRLYSEEV